MGTIRRKLLVILLLYLQYKSGYYRLILKQSTLVRCSVVIIYVFCLITNLLFFVFFQRIPLSTYGLLAFLTVATMGLSNSSVGYLNYPTQVVFKCCKLIPVMIGGILIQGKLIESQMTVHGAFPMHAGKTEKVNKKRK